MLKFFGISKKDKISAADTSKIFSVALNKVVDGGFSEIQNFLNANQNLEKSPNISDSDIRWFRLIIFVGNLHLLRLRFEDEESLKLRNYIIDYLMDYIDKDSDLAMDMFLDYEKYFNEVLSKYVETEKSMAMAIFDKYKINTFQSDLFQRKNEPNPILFNELNKLLSHFIWNWDEFLDKKKIVF